jgi:hypothetical protein
MVITNLVRTGIELDSEKGFITCPAHKPAGSQLLSRNQAILGSGPVVINSYVSGLPDQNRWLGLKRLVYDWFGLQ